MTFKDCFSDNCKLVDQVTEQMRSFNLLGYDLFCFGETAVDKKLETFNHMCGVMR